MSESGGGVDIDSYKRVIHFKEVLSNIIKNNTFQNAAPTRMMGKKHTSMHFLICHEMLMLIPAHRGKGRLSWHTVTLPLHPIPPTLLSAPGGIMDLLPTGLGVIAASSPPQWPGNCACLNSIPAHSRTCQLLSPAWGLNACIIGQGQEHVISWREGPSPLLLLISDTNSLIEWVNTLIHYKARIGSLVIELRFHRKPSVEKHRPFATVILNVLLCTASCLFVETICNNHQEQYLSVSSDNQ